MIPTIAILLVFTAIAVVIWLAIKLVESTHD